MSLRELRLISIPKERDICSVDHTVNHPVNAVKQPSCDTPLSACYMRGLLRYQRLGDEARSRKVISSVFRGCSSAGLCMLVPLK
jgi:hypothetical protein